MKTTKFELELQKFDGFYESRLYNSDMEYYAIQEQIDYIKDNYIEPLGLDIDIEYDDCDFNFEQYKKDICKTFVHKWANYVPLVKKAEFSSLYSPREYNFSTDRLYANVELVLNWKEQMLNWIQDNLDLFKETIEKDWSSRDGFMSFISTSVEEWKDKIIAEDPLYMSILLYYMADNYNNNQFIDYVVEDTICDICVSDYIESPKIDYCYDMDSKIQNKYIG